MIVFDNISDFNTQHIFDCGQCFRWNREEDGSYTGIAGGKRANISFSDGTVYVDDIDVNRDFWYEYLDLGRDYGRIKKELSKDPVVKEAIYSGEGIRILKQDKWETIISFIISQNNNIPRIKGCIENLSRMYGDEIADGCYAFPDCRTLAGLCEEDLMPVRLGYRAKYIVKTAKDIYELGGEVYLEQGDNLTGEEVYSFLRGLTGVGPKVADCIMLFGYGRYDAFPVDVWVKRLMARLYGFTEDDTNGMHRFALETFGEYGGFAQQYLFYHIRQLDV